MVSKESEKKSRRKTRRGKRYEGEKTRNREGAAFILVQAWSILTVSHRSVLSALPLCLIGSSLFSFHLAFPSHPYLHSLAFFPPASKMPPKVPPRPDPPGDKQPGRLLKFKPKLVPRRPKQEPSDELLPAAAAATTSGDSRTGSARQQRRRSDIRRNKEAPAMAASGPFALGPSHGATHSRSNMAMLPPPRVKLEAYDNDDGNDEDMGDGGYSKVDLLRIRAELSRQGHSRESPVNVEEYMLPVSMAREDHADKQSESAEKASRAVTGGVVRKVEEDDGPTEVGTRPRRQSTGSAHGGASGSSGARGKKSVRVMTVEEAAEERRVEMDVRSLAKVFDASLQMQRVATNEAEGNLFFFQLPHVLPPLAPQSGAYVKEEPKNEALKDDEDAESAHAPAMVAEMVENIKKETDTPSPETEGSFPPPQGRIGTLKVRSSGRATIDWGGVPLNVSIGSSNHFVEDVVHVDTQNGAFRLLGQVGQKVIITPDIESLLHSSHGRRRGR